MVVCAFLEVDLKFEGLGSKSFEGNINDESQLQKLQLYFERKLLIESENSFLFPKFDLAFQRFSYYDRLRFFRSKEEA